MKLKNKSFKNQVVFYFAGLYFLCARLKNFNLACLLDAVRQGCVTCTAYHWATLSTLQVNLASPSAVVNPDGGWVGPEAITAVRD